MDDYVWKYGRQYDFTAMTVTSSDKVVYRLEVRNGTLGWLWHGKWLAYKRTEMQEAYQKWLDEQIYGL